MRLSLGKNILKQQALEEHYLSMNQYENNIMSSNRDALICGIDEVGRGPWLDQWWLVQSS